jgi:DNA helicase-2/ATP-dependent DNA helicase PcrA
MTRAMEQLTITCAAERLRFGSRMYGVPSRFLEEIPASVVERAGGKRASRRSRPASGDASYDYSYAQTDPGEAVGVAPGLRVRHPHFILSVAGSGPSQKLKVNFERAGVKTLVVKYANLELG